MGKPKRHAGHQGSCPECHHSSLHCVSVMGYLIDEEYFNAARGFCKECGGLLVCDWCATRERQEKKRGKPVPRNMHEALRQGFQFVKEEPLTGITWDSEWRSGYIELSRGNEILRIPIGADVMFYEPFLMPHKKTEKPVSDTAFLRKCGVAPARIHRGGRKKKQSAEGAIVVKKPRGARDKPDDESGEQGTGVLV